MSWGGPVLGVALVLCVSLALVALLGRAARWRLMLSWISMLGFAALASASMWRGEELHRSGTPITYSFPTVPPGPQKLRIPKFGVVPGFRVDLVNPEGKPVDASVLPQLESCEWRLEGVGALFAKEPFFESEEDRSEIVLTYSVSARTAPILENLRLKAGCPPGARKGLAQGISFARSSMGIFLAGLLLASAGAVAQRKKIKLATAPAPSTSGPPGP